MAEKFEKFIVYGFTDCEDTKRFMSDLEDNGMIFEFRNLDKKILDIMKQSLDEKKIRTPVIFKVDIHGEHEYIERKS